MKRAARVCTVTAALLAMVGCERHSSRNDAGALSVTSATGASAQNPPTARSSIRNPEFLEQYARTYRFRAGAPTAITPTPDGKSVLFLRSGPRSAVQDLYEFDCATGKERVLLTAEKLLNGVTENLTPEELARRERMRQMSRGIASFELSEDGERLLVPLSGRLFVIQRETEKITEFKSDAGAALDPHFSPDGNKVACVRGSDLYVIDVVNGMEKRLTTASKPTITNGLAEFAAQEEMDRFRGFWWSPDSTLIVYEEADTEGMETFTIADPVRPDEPSQSWPYPRAGKQNAKVRLGVISIHGGDTKWLDWNDGINGKSRVYEYMADVCWKKDALLTITAMNRAQTDVGVFQVNGFGAHEILSEAHPAWVNLHPHTPAAWPFPRKFFLWCSERQGWPTLGLYDEFGGCVKEIAGRDEGFVALAHPGKSLTDVYLIVSDTPDSTQVARVEWAEGHVSLRRLTSGRGEHGIVAGDDKAAYVISTTDLGGHRDWTVCMHSGERVGQLNDASERPALAIKPTLEVVGEKNFNAAVLRPTDFDPHKTYPVILSVYAGPHVTVVNSNQWSYALNQWFADQGFIVVMLDGRGTPRRGTEWERAIKNDLGTIPLEDQVAGLQALGVKHPEMDMKRVGVYGWSFGGYFSAMAAMRRPDVFAAACAGAPVCDWRDYDTCYTERYLGDPNTNAAAYDKSSVLTYCKDLRIPLLVIHGTADDNVYFMHSLKMTDALFKAGKPYEFLVLPGFTHMVADPVVTRSLYTRVAEFFLSKLGTPK